MIVICVIVAVIGIVCALIKASIDDRLEDLGMKGQSRLSLRRSQLNEACGTHNDPVEISDDESFDFSSSIQKNTKECTNVTSHGAASVSNSDANVSSLECHSKHVSDDLSSDEDVIVVDDGPNTFQKSPSMFNWNPMANPFHQNIIPESSSSSSTYSKKVFTESPIKRQKLMNDLASCNSSFSDKSTNSDILIEDISPPQVTIQHDVLIAGTNVKFPVKPYPCQIAVMNSLIKGCTKEQNCLLESPTGSGKTLALLCGALAWQEQYSEKLRREESKEMGIGNSCCDNDDSFNDNFLLNPTQYFDEKLHDKISHKAWRVPKIYYGTRTHKQIEQVIREFKKTAYRNKRMTILSSREQTCIQETKKNKNELCNELLDPLKKSSCPYYNEHSKKKATTFSAMNTPWDIEDLVSIGKEIKACPYFGARSLMADAEIIFCPYNYVINPYIRESMQINLKGDIIILDEAHNIEDICRETASVNLRDDEITNAAKECTHLLRVYKVSRRTHVICDTIREYLTDVVKFFKSIEVNGIGSDREMTSNHWRGNEFRVMLDMNNIACPRFSTFLDASKAAIEDFKKNMREEDPKKMVPTISRDAVKTLEYLCFAIQMIISDNSVNDYRVYVVETMEPSKITTDDGWISTTSTKIKVRTMKLICLNPAVIFVPLALLARSVILASGTLTPTTSFQSELGTKFPHIVNPNHIIPKNQMYVRCIPKGPNGQPLIANFEHVNSWNFQDELGNLIIQVCDAVPYGVLCFFSSYNAMSNIHNRWRNKGIWDKLSELKKIFVEPKESRELPGVMRAYRSVIEESSSKSFRVACGAILFAVFRGKVAEGIDFSDNEARCVIAVGIPYFFKSNDIKMKMDYNNENKSKGLLSGSEWYTVNAFRAINQGIGRCVRHKGDWGAVLLVDKRFQQPQYNYKEQLPKWIKTNMKSDDDYDLTIELQNFVAMQAARERGEKCVEN